MVWSAKLSISSESLYLFPLFISREYLHKALTVVHIRDSRGFVSKLYLLLFQSCYLYSSEERPYLSNESPSLQLRQGAQAIHGWYDLIFCCVSELFCLLFAFSKFLGQIRYGLLSFDSFLLKTSFATFFDVFRNLSIFVGTQYHYVFCIHQLALSSVGSSYTFDACSIGMSDSSISSIFQQAAHHEHTFLDAAIPFGEISAFSHFRDIKQAANCFVVYARSVGA